MTRDNVSSSNISSIGYDPKNEVLEVAFLDGSIYQYLEVPESVYKSMMKSPSKGKYLHNNLKEIYIYGKIN